LKIHHKLGLAALSLALAASFSTSAVFADSVSNAPQPSKVSIASESTKMTIYRYYNVGDGVEQAIGYADSDGWVGILYLVSYSNDGNVVYAKYQGIVYR